MKRFFLAPFLVVLLYLLFPQFTSAQQTGISLSPSLSEVVLRPGNSTNLKYYLENVGDPALISLKVLSIEPSDYHGNVRLKSQIKSPISFSIEGVTDNSFIMKTHETKIVNLHINVPENIPEHDYYYSLVAQTDPPPSSGGDISAKAQLAIGSNILISVLASYPPDEHSRIIMFESPDAYKLNFFGNRYSIINTSKPLSLILTVINKGKHRIKPDGSVSIKNTFGYSKDYTIRPQNILAEWQRVLKAEPTDSLNESSLVINNIPFGVYTSKALISFPTGTEKLEATYKFIALPFNLLVCVIIVLIALLMSLHI